MEQIKSSENMEETNPEKEKDFKADNGTPAIEADNNASVRPNDGTVLETVAEEESAAKETSSEEKPVAEEESAAKETSSEEKPAAEEEPAAKETSSEEKPAAEEEPAAEGLEESEIPKEQASTPSLNKDFHISNEERLENLKAKRQIIEELKQLITKEESGGQTFQEFRALQERWRNIGQVPLANVSEIWENYHLHVENFYNYIKINKELRDLDLKHNLDIKESLCKQAETLSKSEDIPNAFRTLQALHIQWKETGPVVKEKKEELWDTFKNYTSVINEKYHIYFEELRKRQESILVEKEELCKAAEDIAETAYSSMKEWQKATEALLDLQKKWKDLGEVAPKDRNKIFKKFRTSCDKFFNGKRDFFKEALKEQDENLRLKEALCERVEALQDSEEWRMATDAIIAAQKEWKGIGTVPQKYSQKIWKRFRAACDVFFNRKNEHFKSIDDEQTENLAAKKKLIEELESFTLSEDQEENLMQLKDIQKKWNTIGYVPIKKKEAVQEQYRNAVNSILDHMDIPNKEKEIERFRSKISSLDDNKDKCAYKIVNEREKLTMQIRQLETDINTLENNMGFLTASKSAELLIADLNKKAQQSKEKLTLLKEKLKELDKII